MTPVLGSGDGFLYRIAPVLTSTLSGSVAKVYDGNTGASLASASVGVSGAIDGDSVAFSVGSASFDNRNVGSGKVVSVPVTLTGASNGAMPVYGYAVAGGGAAAAIGSISPATLVIAAGADSKVYDGSTASAVTPGVAPGWSAATPSAAWPRASTAATPAAAAARHRLHRQRRQRRRQLQRRDDTAAGSITPAPLDLGGGDRHQGLRRQHRLRATPTAAGLVGGDSVSALIQAFDSRNAGSRTLIVDGGYRVNDGNGGANYSVATGTAAGGDHAGDADDRRRAPTPRSTTAAPLRRAIPTAYPAWSPATASRLHARRSTAATRAARKLRVTRLHVNDGNGGANYALTTAAAPGTIGRATLTLGAVGDSKVYDGNAASTARADRRLRPGRRRQRRRADPGVRQPRRRRAQLGVPATR